MARAARQTKRKDRTPAIQGKQEADEHGVSSNKIAERESTDLERPAGFFIVRERQRYETTPPSAPSKRDIALIGAEADHMHRAHFAAAGAARGLWRISVLYNTYTDTLNTHTQAGT